MVISSAVALGRLLLGRAFVAQLVIRLVDQRQDAVEVLGLGCRLAVAHGCGHCLLAGQFIQKFLQRRAAGEAVGNAPGNRDRQGEVGSRIGGPAVHVRLGPEVGHDLARSGVDVVGCTPVVPERPALDAHVFHRIHQVVLVRGALDLVHIHLSEVAGQWCVTLVRCLVVDVAAQCVGLLPGESARFWQAGEQDGAVSGDPGLIATHHDSGIQLTGEYLCRLGGFDTEVRHGHYAFHVTFLMCGRGRP